MKKSILVIALVLFAFLVMAMPQAEAQVTKHTVTLTWTQAQTTGITITNTLVFRGTAPGGSKVAIGQTNSTALTWTDSNVANGATYYYVVAAVSSTGQQSADSPEASAVIPQETPAPASLTTKVN